MRPLWVKSLCFVACMCILFLDAHTSATLHIKTTFRLYFHVQPQVKKFTAIITKIRLIVTVYPEKFMIKLSVFAYSFNCHNTIINDTS